MLAICSFVIQRACKMNESALCITFGAHPADPIISFAQIPILIFKDNTKFWRLGVFLSNFIWFLSYHKDQMTQPSVSVQMSLCFLRLTRPIHCMLKPEHWLWMGADMPHHFRISIQALQENLQSKRMWEFDSSVIPQNGQLASWGLMIPFSTSKSPVFSFSLFASQTVSFARGGMNFCQIMEVSDFGREGTRDSYNLFVMSFVG